MLSSLSSLSSFSLSFPVLSLVFLSILSPFYTNRGRDNDRERVRVTSLLPSLVACLVPRLVRLYCTLFLIESVFRFAFQRTFVLLILYEYKHANENNGRIVPLASTTVHYLQQAAD